jgi:hypothetical protein
MVTFFDLSATLDDQIIDFSELISVFPVDFTIDPIAGLDHVGAFRCPGEQRKTKQKADNDDAW